MKILIIITGLDLGGAEVQVSQLCDQFANSGHEVKIITMMGSIQVSPKNNNIEIYQLGMTKKPLSILKSILSARKFINYYNPDIIHSHLFHANIFSRILKIFNFKLKLINTEHSKYIGSNLRKFIYKKTRFIPNYCTNVSKEALDNFTSHQVFSKEKSSCIYNGIDTTHYIHSEKKRIELRRNYNIPENTKLILAVGRLVPAKDYANLLKSISINQHNILLWIIGDGIERDTIENKITKLKIENKVKLLGKKTNITDYLSACDLFVSSSAWEGFGLVIAEAMSCEKIVVATDSGGIKEVLSDCGFIAPIRDHIKLNEQISNALNLNNIDSDSLRKKSREHILSNFSLLSISDSWLKLYKKIINN